MPHTHLNSVSLNNCRVATRSGKSGKAKKNDKSQEKMGVFVKKSENLTKFEKASDFFSLNLLSSFFSIWKEN